MNPVFFRSASEFRQWLAKNHLEAAELWVGFHKVETGRPSMTWPDSVDEALCFGWIDGLRKSFDEGSYVIRFTPRKPGSVWSAVNIKKAEALIQKGLMQAGGLKAYGARRENKSGIYSYEQRSVDFAEPYGGILKKNKAAWDFFHSQPPSYRKAVTWWVCSAKQEETRLKRIQKLVEDSAKGIRIAQFTRTSTGR